MDFRLSLADVDSSLPTSGSSSGQYPHLSTVSYGDSVFSFASRLRLKTHQAISIEQPNLEMSRHPSFPQVIKIEGPGFSKGHSYKSSSDAIDNLKLPVEGYSLTEHKKDYSKSKHPLHHTKYPLHPSQNAGSLLRIGGTTAVYRANPLLGRQAVEEAKTTILKKYNEWVNHQKIKFPDHNYTVLEQYSYYDVPKFDDESDELDGHYSELHRLKEEDSAIDISISKEDAHYIRSQTTQFEKLRSVLLEKYAGQYVLFEDGEVLDHSNDEYELASRAYEKYGMKVLFIERVLPEKTISPDEFPRLVPF